MILAGHGEAHQAVAVARQCEDGTDRNRLTLEAIAALARRGGQADLKTAVELLRTTDSKSSLLTSAAPGWHIPGIELLLVSQNRLADAKSYILKALDDAFKDRIGGYDSIPDFLKAADQMARRGDQAASREIYSHVLAGLGNSNPETPALKLKAGLVTKDQIRGEATMAMNEVEVAEHPFRVAMDAARSAKLYALIGAFKESQEALVLAIDALPKLQPPEERKRTLLGIAKLTRNLNRTQIRTLSKVATVIAEQQENLESGDDIFHAISPLLARHESLLAGRRMADQIVNADVRLKTYVSLLDVYLSKTEPDYATNIIPDDKVPATVAMNTELPPKR